MTNKGVGFPQETNLAIVSIRSVGADNCKHDLNASTPKVPKHLDEPLPSFK